MQSIRQPPQSQGHQQQQNRTNEENTKQKNKSTKQLFVRKQSGTQESTQSRTKMNKKTLSLTQIINTRRKQFHKQQKSIFQYKKRLNRFAQK